MGRFTNLLAFLILGLAAGCATSNVGPPGALTISDGWQLQDAAKVSGSGETISQPTFTSSDWYKATVPGTVLTSLVNCGVYPDPLYGENNRPDKIPESLCRTSYWYRTQVQVPREWGDKHVWLHFAGINYIADVWVNGHSVGSIKGAFIRGVFDVTPFVTAGQTATVAVHILPPPHPGEPHEHTVLAGTGLNGGLLAIDGPTFLCTVGWDWIPGIRDRDMGIWQKVTLFPTGPVVVEDPLITSDLPLPRTDVADLTVQTTVRNLSDAPQSGVLRGVFDDRTFEIPVALQAGETQHLTLTSTNTPQLHIEHPRLWWPNGYGPQNLSTMHLSFDVGGQPSDERDIQFGIRKITYQVPGSDNLTISVNGVPVICKGGDWGMDEAMKHIGRDRLEAQIRMHQIANYTMIRNWVGQSTSDDFYDLCDQYGILIWDEFFQPNRSDGPNPVNTQMYLANVRDKVLRYRNHPSIALWCARNESDPPPEIDQGIIKIMAELEPTRLYQRSSTDGRGVRSGGPYSWRVPRAYYSFRAIEAFKTEIGSVSVPTIESIHAMMPEKDWGTVNDDWALHDLCKGAQQGYRNPTSYPATIAHRYGTLENLADFVRKSQLANYEAFRAMYEGRFVKLFKPVTGVLTWMSNPAQSSFVWQIYAHDLEPNSSLFAVRKACEPVHIQMNENDFRVMVINNKPETLDGLTADIRVFNLDGSLKSRQSIKLGAAPSAATEVGSITWPADLSAVHFVKLELRDSKQKLISDNFYWRTLPGNPDDFKTMQDMPAVNLASQISRHDADGKCLIDVTLSNPTQSIAVMAHVQLRRQDTNQRVLPVYYSDNYVSLLPGESRTISIEAASDLVGGAEPLVVLDGWNVTTDSRSCDTANGPVAISVNAEAQVNSNPMTGLILVPQSRLAAR